MKGKVRSVAYIRVSTMKEEQALSLQNQEEFFKTYITNRGEELVRIYSDKGKSATKMQNRVDLQHMIKDAKLKKFDKIYVKDISRIFRNTLDFITFSRELVDKHGIQLHLVNFGEGRDMDSFTLNLLAMMAEQESTKISERVKFGKKFSKENGIVPNFIFGYERVDKYTLKPNEDSEWVKKIFDLYTESNWGEARIAKYLYEQRVKTSKLKDGKPNYNWSAKTVDNLLKNQIYIGRVINGKQTTKDLYSGERINNDEEDWYVTEKPEFRLISDEQFFKAQKLIEQNKELFPSKANGRRTGTRRSEALLYSNLLKCPTCGSSYRRYHRKHSENGPVYEWWVCGGRSKYGSARCTAEHIRIEESSITASLSDLFHCLIKDKDEFFKLIESKTRGQIKQHINQSSSYNLEEIEEELKDLQKQRENIKVMMKKGLLDIDEGADDMNTLNKDIKRLSDILNQQDVTQDLTNKIKENLSYFFLNFENFSFGEGLDNASLKMIVKEITVISKKEIQVHFNVTDDISELMYPLILSDLVPSKNMEEIDTNCEHST